MVFNITFKKFVIIHIVLIFLIVLITARIITKEKNYDCENCIVSFKETDRFMEEITKTINVPLQELYEEYLNGSCPIEWNKGFVINKDLNITFGNG